MAGELHRWLVLEDGAEDIVAHQLGERIHDADIQTQGSRAGTLLRGMQDFER